jgi:hypothetical protein
MARQAVVRPLFGAVLAERRLGPPHLGFGRIVVSATKAPNMLAYPVRSG